ncbi:2'-5' RNA ligase family protein [Rhizobium sp. BK661]|uniref:2'-5' RNA ligase family protein n=1 Tax=Rhizobium sp. BK661 TaxID=2586991 RepID=UPI003864DAD0
MILTARLPEQDLAFFDGLRRIHFPPGRNHVTAHLTVFYRVSDWHLSTIHQLLEVVASSHSPMQASTTGIWHLGSGVAFTLDSPELERIRGVLREKFEPWLSPEDKQGWRPHITIQNGADRARVAASYAAVTAAFQPRLLSITGLDLWTYRGGPWRAEGSFAFSDNDHLGTVGST